MRTGARGSVGRHAASFMIPPIDRPGAVDAPAGAALHSAMPDETTPAAPPIGRTGRTPDPARARPLLPTAVATEVSTPWAIAALLAANLAPLVGVLALGWSVSELMILYWFENGVIGFFGILKILLAGGPILLRLFTAAFFSFHYGAFWSAHGFFVASIFGGGIAAPAPDLGLAVGFFFGGLGIAGGYLRGAVALSAMALIVSHAVSFLGNVIGRREDLDRPPQELMAQPYARVFVLHVTLILGAVLVFGLGEPAAGLALFVLLKTGVDLAAHLRSHRPRATG
jgi:hypothetical protein